MSLAIGIDIGGTGIKMAQVDTQTGELLTERHKFLTPRQGSPEEIANMIKQKLDLFQWKGPIGVGFPTPIRNGVCTFHSNLSPLWEGLNLPAFFEENFGSPVVVANDVDVAALAEIHFGEIDETLDKVVFLALGTGIGSAIIHKGQLLYGTELGHFQFKGGIAEEYASNRTREQKALSWKKWGRRLNKVLKYYDFVLCVDQFVLGGGVSKKFDKYKEFLDIEVPVKPAKLLNTAGVIGAAMLTTKSS